MISFRRTTSTYKLSTTFFLIIFVIIGVLSSFQSISAQCFDSDITDTYLTGNNPFEAGTCLEGSGPSYSDKCLDESTLQEYYCNVVGPGTCSPNTITCSSGTCSGDVCTVVGGGSTTLPNSLQVNSLQELLNRVLNLLIIFATPVYLLVIFLGALTFIVGGADPSKRRLAKNMLLYATIGFLILVMARVLLKAVETLLILK